MPRFISLRVAFKFEKGKIHGGMLLKANFQQGRLSLKQPKASPREFKIMEKAEN